jgi:hypothetical protein
VSLQLLKQRVSQLENTAQQTDVVRQENALLRQQLLEMEAAVRGEAYRVVLSSHQSWPLSPGLCGVLLSVLALTLTCTFRRDSQATLWRNVFDWLSMPQ